MAETDPEYKAGQVGAPDSRVIHAGGADAIIQLIKPGEKEAQQGGTAGCRQGDIVLRASFYYGPYDIIVDVVVA